MVGESNEREKGLGFRENEKLKWTVIVNDIGV